MNRISRLSTTAVIVTVLSLFVSVLGVTPDRISLAQAQTSSDVLAWGRNSQGQLGNGTTEDSPTPVDVPDLSGVAVIGAGGEHSLAALSDGTVWAWGQNANGQLGDGTLTDRSTPIQVTGLLGIIQVDGGLAHSLALRDDGTVWAWGLNARGQLGDGTTSDSASPVEVQGLSGVTAVAAGGDHSLALKSDGTVWAWGKNSDGQLGNGSKKKSSTPVQVSNLTDVAAIAGGDAHSLAVKADGTTWAWGDNFYGQLGDGSTRDRNTPVQVTGLTGGTSVAGGSFHSLAVKSDGTVWAWGRNVFGQLGDGTTVDRSTPVQTSELTVATGISAGAHHSLAADSDGTSWAWGLNLYGQLGDGTSTNRSTPVQASTSEPSDAVEAGAFHSLSHIAQVDTTPPAVTLDQPNEGDIVFHIETLSATATDDVAVDRVEFLVDGAVVGTDLDSPYQLEWDTSSAAAGDHSLKARAFDTAGNTAETVSVTVNVSNGLTGAERIKTDFDQGVLTVDEYVEYGIWSLHNLDLLPDRYRAGGAFVDGSTGAAIAFLAYWDQLQVATQDRISAFMSVQEVILPDGGGALFQTSSVTWPECNDDNVWLRMFDKATACKHDVTITAGGPVVFEVHYTVDGEDDPALLVEIQTQAPGITRWSETVEAVDQIYRDGTRLVQCDPIDFGNCNKVPDAIDRIAVSLAQSYVTYETDLGYRPLTDLPVDVAVHNTGGQVAPPGLGSLIVEVDNNAELYYLPRHELFHAYQYNYVNLNDLIPDLLLDGKSDINWWMEATAEWAAHQVAEAWAPASEATNYADPLDSFLGAPQRKLDEWDGFRQPRQYGAFILAEYLEERAGPDSIRSSWAAIDGYGGNPLQAIEDQLTAVQSDWGTELPAFWLANYLLKSPDNAAPYTDTHADTVWRGDLNQEPNLQGETDSRAIALGLDQARPLRDSLRLADGTPESDAVTIERGGASYIDLVPLDSTPGTLRTTIRADSGAPMTAQLQGFTTYPDPCGPPTTIPLAEAGALLQGETTIPIEASCQFATLIITNNDPTNGPIDIDWEAEYRACVEPVVYGSNVLHDPGFENTITATGGGPSGNEIGGVETFTSNTVVWPSDGSLAGTLGGGLVDPWNWLQKPGSRPQFGAGTPAWYIDTANPDSGAYHARISFDSNSSSSRPSQLLAGNFKGCVQPVDPFDSGFGVPAWRVDQGATIRSSVRIMASTTGNGEQFLIHHSFYDANWEFIANDAGPKDNTFVSTSYETKMFESIAPPGTHYFILQIEAVRHTNTGGPLVTFDLDSMVLEFVAPSSTP